MDEAVSDTERNICATSYVTAVNSRPMAYIILKVIRKWKNKDWSIKKWYLFAKKVHLFQYKSQFNKAFNVNPGNQGSPIIFFQSGKFAFWIPPVSIPTADLYEWEKSVWCFATLCRNSVGVLQHAVAIPTSYSSENDTFSLPVSHRHFVIYRD
jgi:hypothetical protein